MQRTRREIHRKNVAKGALSERFPEQYQPRRGAPRITPSLSPYVFFTRRVSKPSCCKPPATLTLPSACKQASRTGNDQQDMCVGRRLAQKKIRGTRSRFGKAAYKRSSSPPQAMEYTSPWAFIMTTPKTRRGATIKLSERRSPRGVSVDGGASFALCSAVCSLRSAHPDTTAQQMSEIIQIRLFTSTTRTEWAFTLSCIIALFVHPHSPFDPEFSATRSTGRLETVFTILEDGMPGGRLETRGESVHGLSARQQGAASAPSLSFDEEGIAVWPTTPPRRRLQTGAKVHYCPKDVRVIAQVVDVRLSTVLFRQKRSEK